MRRKAHENPALPPSKVLPGLLEARSPDTPAAELEVLARSKRPAVQFAVGRNPSTPATVRHLAFELLIAKAGPQTMKKLAADRNCPAVQRTQACARVWWHEATATAKKFKSEAVLADLPKNPGADQLVALFQQESEDLILDPQASRIGAVIGTTGSNILSVASDDADSACNSPLRAARLLGLCQTPGNA